MEKKVMRATTATVFIPDTKAEQPHDEYLKSDSKLSCGIMILDCKNQVSSRTFRRYP